MEAMETSLQTMNDESVNPFYEVGRFPLVAKTRTPDGHFGPTVEAGYDLLVNMEDHSPVGLISPGYNLVTNRELDVMIQEATDGISIHSIQDHMNANGSAWIRRMIFDADNMTFDVTGNNDIVKIMLEISNSYNGQSSLEMNMKLWRKICVNGLMGWTDYQQLRFKHLVQGIVERLKDLFRLNVDRASAQVNVWSDWAEITFPQQMFNDFIDMHKVPLTDEEAETKSPVPRMLSDRQAGFIKDRYEPIMNEYGENETKWGAYNVLTAIATHDIKTRKPGTSPLFTAAYARMEKLIGSFYNNQPENLLN